MRDELGCVVVGAVSHLRPLESGADAWISAAEKNLAIGRDLGRRQTFSLLRPARSPLAFEDSSIAAVYPGFAAD